MMVLKQIQRSPEPQHTHHLFVSDHACYNLTSFSLCLTQRSPFCIISKNSKSFQWPDQQTAVNETEIASLLRALCFCGFSLLTLLITSLDHLHSCSFPVCIALCSSCPCWNSCKNGRIFKCSFPLFQSFSVLGGVPPFCR